MDGIEDKDFQTAKERFDRTLDYYSGEYQEAEKDVDFALGEQWPEEELRKRKEDHRPALTENHCMPYIDRIVNDAREMRPSVKVSPVDDKGDQDTAEVFKGLIRNIERRSKASVAYDTAVQNSVSSGYGWITIGVDYTDPKSFRQEVNIDTVVDWRSCMIDPSSTMIDGSDAEYGFKYVDLEEEVFKAKYPDKEVLDFEGDWVQGAEDDKKVRVVDYYTKVYEDDTIYELYLNDNTRGVFTKSQKEDLEKVGAVAQVLQERETKIPKVKACKLYGGGVLEETDWLGQYIPIIPVYGKLVWHKGRLKAYSLIKHAKDPQRMLNIVKTTIAEIVGSQPKNQPMVGAVGQFETDGRWENANTENYATLEYDPVFITDEAGQSMLAPPPVKSQPLNISAALFQIEANAKLGMNAALGMYEEGRGEESNAISGVAIQSRQIRGDKATFHFIDNLACSIRHVGVVCSDLIPKIYNEEQIVRIIGSDDREKTVTLNPKEHNPSAGVFNPHAGEYDVDVDVGPSYATKQQEFVNISTELLRVMPEYGALAADKIIEAVGGPNADVISERIRAMNPNLQSDDPMASMVMELKKQLEGAKQEMNILQTALDEKKKNEQAELSLKDREVGIKAEEAKTKRLETMAKIEEMKINSQGLMGEVSADLADAIMEMDGSRQEHEQVISTLIDQVAELKAAIAQPEQLPEQTAQ